MDYLNKMPQVAVMLPPSLKVCRDMRQGILRYVRTHGPWSLHLIDDRSDQTRISGAPEIYGGLIGQPVTEAEYRFIMTRRIPMVLVDPQVSVLTAAYRRVLARNSLIRCDTAAVGRCAAKHFLERGFRHFAYVGATVGSTWSTDRLRAFAREVRKASFGVHVLRAKKGPESTLSDDLAELCAWLLALPKPCAIFCAWDLRARQVIDACKMADINVPGEVAVLGVDDDEALCLSSYPPISSVRLDAERAGYDAAKLLDDMLRGVRGRRIISYGPVGVTVRETATVIARANDPVVNASVEFIEINATHGLVVGDVAKHVGVSVRVLERRFGRLTGKTVQNVIEDVKLERVKTLLSDTNESVKSIALNCGFSTVSHLTARFRLHEKMTMSDYRKRCGRIAGPLGACD